MNQDKIGEFIQQRRKALGLTQKELADKLGISDKTVSKWETGKGMPDISSIPELCKILNVSINELLLGEEISQEDLSKKTEENIMSLLNSNHKQRKYVIIQLCLGIGLLIFSVVLLSFSGFQNKGMLKNYLDYPSLIILLLICAACVLISGAHSFRQVVHILRKIVIPVSFVITIFTLISTLSDITSFTAIAGNLLAIVLLTPLYALIIYIITILIESNNKKRDNIRS